MTPRLGPALTWLTLAAPWLTACDRGHEPAPSAESAEASASPSSSLPLRVEPAEHDLGSLVQFQEVRRAFTVTNAGAATVTLQGVTVGHSCSAAPVPAPLGPGESLALELRCQPRMHGVFLDQIRLRTDVPNQRELRIVSSGRVIPAAAFDRNLLEVRLPFGERRVEEVRARGARSGELKLRLRPADQERWRTDGLTVTALPAEQGRGAGLRIQLEGRRVGKHAGTLVAETGLEGEPRELILPYAFHVPGTLTVQPEPVYVNLRAPRDEGAALDVRSTQPGFRVEAIRLLEGPFEVTSERIGAGHHRARIHVRVEQLDDDVRGVIGRLEVRSNDRTEPRKEVPLFAFGKPLP